MKKKIEGVGNTRHTRHTRHAVSTMGDKWAA